MAPLPPRGQTLVLMALTLLLLVVSVLTTLTLSTRIKSRLEMQTLADANAYSNAVVTARTFNSISIMNRAGAATLAAMAGAAAYISYGTQGVAMNRALKEAVRNTTCHKPPDDPDATCCDGFPARKDAVIAALQERLPTPLPAEFHTLDMAANGHVAGNRGRATQMKQAAAFMLENMENHIAGTGAPNALASKMTDAGQLREAKVNNIQWLGATAAVNRAETVGSARPDLLERGEGGEALTNGGYGYTVLEATMGTRPDWLINHDIPLHPEDVAACAVSNFSCSSSATGAGYFAIQRHNGGSADLDSRYVRGDAHGQVTVDATVTGGCTVTGGNETATADYKGTDDVIPEGHHEWNPGREDGHADDDTQHTVGGCDVCPSVWYRPYGFLPQGIDARDDNLGGQPKAYAATRLDLAAESNDPWNMVFGRGGGDGLGTYRTTVDGTTPNGLRYQHALGTGVTYYHRPQTWTEPGNFMNPFWRATLSHGYVDHSSPGELRAVFVGRSDDAMQGLDALKAAGHAALREP